MTNVKQPAVQNTHIILSVLTKNRSNFLKTIDTLDFSP